MYRRANSDRPRVSTVESGVVWNGGVMNPEQMSPKQLKKFLVYYRKRIEQEPANVEARLRLATVFREMGKTPRAVEQYEQAAQLLDEQGLALEAIAACKAILELDPSRVEAQYFLARLYAQTPDATDGSARVARPIEVDDDEPTHELDDESERLASWAEELDREEADRDEFDRRPSPETVEMANDEEATRVADYSELADEFDLAEGGEGGLDSNQTPTVELTPEERERLQGISREEMQDLLTTIDVDPEDVVDLEEIEDFEFEDEFGTDEFEQGEPDFELGQENEVGREGLGDSDSST